MYVLVYVFVCFSLVVVGLAGVSAPVSASPVAFIGGRVGVGGGVGSHGVL